MEPKSSHANTPTTPVAASPETARVDAFIPAEMARRAEDVGVKKANMRFLQTFLLATLGGAFIGLGAMFSTVVITGAALQLSYGFVRLSAGLSFCLGLVLVVVAGAELFTGNNLIVMAWASKRLSLAALLRNWSIVYLGNFVGALATAALMLLTKQYEFSQGAVGLTILSIADAKCGLTFVQAFSLGVLCNALVCLAVWLCFSARSTTDKIVSILFPVSAFVAAGFEHSIANMYFVPMGLFVKTSAENSFWQSIGRTPETYANLDWTHFLVANLLPVTLGNVVGGAGLVGLVYWFIYVRD